jgi:hypothetical protein
MSYVGLNVGGSPGSVFFGASLQINSGTVSFPAGTQAGDIAIFTIIGGFVPSFSFGTQVITNNNAIRGGARFLNVYTKVLTSGDISSPPTFNTASGLIQTAIWRGGTAVDLKSGPTTGTGSTVTATGFTKNTASKLVISFMYDSAPGPTGLVLAAGFTKCSTDGINDAGVNDDISKFADSDSYVSSANVTWTNLDTGRDSNVTALFEIT